MKIGILGLQGCCEPHRRKFADLGIETQRVIYPVDLLEVDALVMPGGESTTMLKTAKSGLWEALESFGREKPVWGICAGCILMASEVHHPEQRSLGLMDITVSRNAYGAQLDSFIAEVQIELSPVTPVRAIFIRAPRITRIGAGVRVLASHGGDPIMVASNRHLASTFHPELTDGHILHRYFTEHVAASCAN